MLPLREIAYYQREYGLICSKAAMLDCLGRLQLNLDMENIIGRQMRVSHFMKVMKPILSDYLRIVYSRVSMANK